MSAGLIAFTLLHVAISLVAIGAGFIVVHQMINNRRLGVANAIFLWATILTSVSGFGFPFVKVTPAHGFAVISLAVLAVSSYALYKKHLQGAWRAAYIGTAMFAFYLNFFVLIVQSFQKVPFLKTLAPTQTEPAFAIAQGVALIGFLAMSYFAVRRFHPVETNVRNTTESTASFAVSHQTSQVRALAR